MIHSLLMIRHQRRVTSGGFQPFMIITPSHYSQRLLSLPYTETLARLATCEDTSSARGGTGLASSWRPVDLKGDSKPTKLVSRAPSRGSALTRAFFHFERHTRRTDAVG